MRLVLDTSVIISAVRSKSGASAKLVRLALKRKFELLLSAPLLLEYESVLKRPEHLRASGFSFQDVDVLLTRLSEVATKMRGLGHFRRPTLSDPDDEHVINLAWRAQVDELVTQNVRDFYPAATELGIKCCLPGQTLYRLEVENGSIADFEN